MKNDYSLEIIKIISIYCNKLNIDRTHIKFKFNDRPHYNQKWKCKVSSSVQVFFMGQKFGSFNYLDLKLGEGFIERKFAGCLFYAIYGRELPTGHYIKRLNNIRYIKIRFKPICKLVLRHREKLAEIEREIQSKKKKKKHQIKTNMEKFL